MVPSPPSTAEQDEEPTAALDPLYPTGLCAGNRVFSSSMAKRQPNPILILGKNPPNHSLTLSWTACPDMELQPTPTGS